MAIPVLVCNYNLTAFYPHNPSFVRVMIQLVSCSQPDTFVKVKSYLILPNVIVVLLKKNLLVQNCSYILRAKFASKIRITFTTLSYKPSKDISKYL